LKIVGKLFKCVELPWLIQFFLMFYNDKPVDWLLDHLISTKVCSLDMDHVSINNNNYIFNTEYWFFKKKFLLRQKHCKMAKAELWVHYKPSLFQHIGTHSSLKGKVQKLKVMSDIFILKKVKYNYDNINV